MIFLVALLLGAVPAPAFDVPVRQISLWLGDQEIVEVTPGRCQLRAPGQAEPTRVTARLTGLRAEDLSSLLMVSLGQGLSSTSWALAELPRGPVVRVTVSSQAEVGGPVFGWSNALALTPNGRLADAWRLYSLFSLCNLGEAVDVWGALMAGPSRQRRLALALATEWMIWANRDEDFVYSLPGLVEQCRAGHCEELPDALGWASRTWAADLRHAFPDMSGLSARNLKYMRAFAAAWPERAIVQQAVAQLTWYHNLELLEKLQDPVSRLICSGASHGLLTH